MTIRQRMQEALPFSAEELELLIATAQYRYKRYAIPKRAGRGFRIIAQPTPEVKLVQRWLVANVLTKLKVHAAATAYRKGSSIQGHAARHALHRFLLKMDFKDFFPSITAENVKQLLSQGGFAEEDVHLITNLTCWFDRASEKKCLSIGAPSSPHISNAMLFDFDNAIFRVARRKRVSYSRYADDLAFSSNRTEVAREMQYEVQTLIEKLNWPKLTINPGKTVSVSKASRRRLVGLILTNDGEVSLGRERKKNLQSRVHKYKAGILVAPEEVSKLRGELAFAWSVESDFIRRLATRYGGDVFRRLELPFAS